MTTSKPIAVGDTEKTWQEELDCMLNLPERLIVQAEFLGKDHAAYDDMHEAAELLLPAPASIGWEALVEKVAAAMICKEAGDAGKYRRLLAQSVQPGEHEATAKLTKYRRLARAAIAAMREAGVRPPEGL